MCALSVRTGLVHLPVIVLALLASQHLVLHGCVLLLPWLQKTITNRLKDLEMFSAGLAQQLIRRQEKFNRTISVLQTGMPT